MQALAPRQHVQMLTASPQPTSITSTNTHGIPTYHKQWIQSFSRRVQILELYHSSFSGRSSSSSTYDLLNRLTATCRFFRNSHKIPLSFQPKDKRNHFLYRLELFHIICLDAGSACFHCCTIKPKSKFSEDQLPMRKWYRLCIDCGEKKTPLRSIVVGRLLRTTH